MKKFIKNLHHENSKEQRDQELSRLAVEKIEKELIAKKTQDESAVNPEASTLNKTFSSDDSATKTQRQSTLWKKKPPVKSVEHSSTQPLFSKTVKQKETETTKWTATEKQLSTDIDLDKLLNEGSHEKKDGKKEKPLFKKRAGKVTK